MRVEQWKKSTSHCIHQRRATLNLFIYLALVSLIYNVRLAISANRNYVWWNGQWCVCVCSCSCSRPLLHHACARTIKYFPKYHFDRFLVRWRWRLIFMILPWNNVEFKPSEFIYASAFFFSFLLHSAAARWLPCFSFSIYLLGLEETRKRQHVLHVYARSVLTCAAAAPHIHIVLILVAHIEINKLKNPIMPYP